MSHASDHFTGGQRLLHWGMAALIVVQVPIGLTMTNLGEGELTNRLYELHKSFGLVLFFAAVARIAVRWIRGAPPLEPMPWWQATAAYASHYAMYMLIVLIPLTGWAATSSCCAPVNLFWTVPMSLPVSWSEEFTKTVFLVHKGLAFTLAAIVLIHASAALFHHFVRRDRTLMRMWRGEPASAPARRA
jgi:cytochrome b561